jgi:UPF0755 protein
LDEKELFYQFNKQSKIKEGVFFADTYELPIGISEKNLIKILLKNSIKKHKRLAINIFGIYNEKKWFRYITIASLIQKESANKEEMPIVASVIYNRLKKGMKLQLDGSLNYGKYSHTKITAKRLREDKSRYNTYLYKGLPPQPVCNVSMDAIKAAIFPAKTPYLYFVKMKNNKHSFSSSYKMHIRKIKRGY